MLSFVWDDDCEHSFRVLKKALVESPVLAYSTRYGHFILSADPSNIDSELGAVLEQEQEEGSQVVRRVIAYASRTLKVNQRWYCTTNKELLDVVTAGKAIQVPPDWPTPYSGD